MPEWRFYCGRVPPPRDANQATQLMLTGGKPNINRKIEVIEKRLVADVPDHLQDLLDIATYVFVADRMVGRGGATLPNMGSDWRRRFRFSIAVRDPGRWNTPDVKTALEDLLGFLSGDHFRFDFFRSDQPPALPRRLPLARIGTAPTRCDQVLMFSGGLDSLAGAVQELSQTNDRDRARQPPIVRPSFQSPAGARERFVNEIPRSSPACSSRSHDERRVARYRIHATDPNFPLLRHWKRCGGDDGLRAHPLFRKRHYELQPADCFASCWQPSNTIDASTGTVANDHIRHKRAWPSLRSHQPFRLANEG